MRRIQSDVVAGGGGSGPRRDEILCADMRLHLERCRNSAMRHHLFCAARGAGDGSGLSVYDITHHFLGAPALPFHAPPPLLHTTQCSNRLVLCIAGGRMMRDACGGVENARWRGRYLVAAIR